MRGYAEFNENGKYIIANPAENVGYRDSKSSEQFPLDEEIIFSIQEQEIHWDGIKVNKIILDDGTIACVPSIIFENIIGNEFEAIPYSPELKKNAQIIIKYLEKQGVKRGTYVYSKDWDDDTPPFTKYKIESIEAKAYGIAVIHTIEDIDLGTCTTEEFQRRYILKLPKWSKSVFDNIRQRKISIGMTRN